MNRFLVAVFVGLTTLLVGCAAASTATPVATPTRPPATTAPAAAPADIVEVTVEGFAFNPATVKVAPGTSVRWTQKDSAAHTATSANGTFDSKNLNQGQTFTFKFDAPGKYEYVCAYHPNMKGTVEVQ